jgi:hypothetical protein
VLVPVVLVAALATGSTAATTPDAAERVRSLGQLVQAVRAGDEPAMWASLSRVSRRRLGPTLADFRRRGARGVRSEVAPFAQGSFRVILNTDVARGLGVIAVAGGRERGAFAVPVRRESGEWKVEIDPAFTVEAVRPLPGEQVLRRTQLFAEVSAPGRIDGAAMWLDGGFFADARGYWSPNKKRMSIWGEAPQPLLSGRHTVVAFASAGSEAAANAWVFTARGRGSGSRSLGRTSP